MLGQWHFTYSWIDKHENSTWKSQLMLFSNLYVPRTLEMTKASIKHVVRLSDISMVYTLCRLLESLVVPENILAIAEASIYEIYFVFASIWRFGGACDDVGRYFRAESSQLWKAECRNVAFPQQGTVFDY
jgi:dynein heavy chain